MDSIYMLQAKKTKKKQKIASADRRRKIACHKFKAKEIQTLTRLCYKNFELGKFSIGTDIRNSKYKPLALPPPTYIHISPFSNG